MRILFTTVALPGHLFPLVPLAWACRALGHEVMVATTDNFLAEVARAGLPVTSCGPESGLRDLRSAAAVALDGDRHPALSMSDQRYAHGLAFARIARRSLDGLRALTGTWRPDVVVSERAELAGPIAAAALGVPSAELHWGAAPLPEYRSAAAAELAGELGDLGLDDLPDPGLLLNPWPPSVRGTYADRHYTLRAVPYNGEARVPAWMLSAADRPRVCLTLGTVLPRLGRHGGAEFLLPLLDRLAGLGLEIVIAVDDEIAATWPRLPDAVRFAGRLPMSHALSTCALSINHGGQGTALTSLAAGTPQLLLPRFDDQFDNADAVVKSGAGLRLLPEEITATIVARRCAELLEDEAYRTAARGIAAEIAAQPSPVVACRRLETLVA
ncbi:nucleotide disphospho-sugar-binding domain-containing protein [Amycolatopsis antarctica]|uniref:nucleotide disphospho-sugar-binding domain-containing protein n=1 Tax=Amycolatopsis antarctica TaxID=1854586 RepID=UPI0013FD1902|nr:nucleotide disphospho-sugar-binding domain-containing protein [Amycolatopsis antarctica]